MLIWEEISAAMGWLLREREFPIWDRIESTFSALEVFSFAFLFGFGVLCLEFHRYSAAIIFFTVGSAFLSVRMIAITYKSLQTVWKWGAVILICVLAIYVDSYLLGITLDAQQEHVADLMERGNADLRQLVADHRKPKPQEGKIVKPSLDFGSEPAERANLHVEGVRFISTEPTQAMLDAWAKLPANTFPVLQAVIPRPEAFIAMKNVGKYKTRGMYWVRAEIALGPNQLGIEKELFAKANWQTGGLIGQNEWYPNDPKIVHTQFADFFEPTDWPAILKGDRGFYVITQSVFADIKGGVKPTESCTFWWYENHVQRSRWCWTHNN
jgi:hypothetical protein